MEKNKAAFELLAFQINRKTSDLAKSFLVIIEDMVDEGVNITDDKFRRIRKRVLDSKGNADRELESVMDKLEIKFKE